MFIVLLKTFHYLAILFAGGVLVGGGLIHAALHVQIKCLILM